MIHITWTRRSRRKTARQRAIPLSSSTDPLGPSEQLSANTVNGAKLEM